MELKWIGKNVTKPDAMAKATGEALYAGDLTRENMLYAKAVRSPYAHARIRSINLAPAFAVPGVEAVLTFRNVPGDNHVGMTGNKDQQVFAADKVCFLGEAVAVVAARTLDGAKRGCLQLAVSYEELPVVETPLQGLTAGTVPVGEKTNLCWHKKIVRGDCEAAIRHAAVVVEGEYITQAVEHAYLEPEAVLVEPVENGIFVWSSTKSVHLDRQEIARFLAMPLENVHVVAPHIGGSFGGKSDLVLNCMAALVCKKTGFPVSMVQEREESIQTSTKRHACTLKYTHAADEEGRLTAVKLELLADAGAYIDYTPSVLQRTIVHGAGPYRVANVWLEGKGVLTNNPVSGAMRGFGVPQAVFACERQMDRLAEKLGMDPLEIRLKNILKERDLLVTGQVVNHQPGLYEGLSKASQIIKDFSYPAKPYEKSAWGVACFHYGNGKTGVLDPGVAGISLLEDGRVRVAVGSPDIGQGSNTVMAQIAAETLGLDISCISFISADTRCTPDSGTTSGTRLTALVGKAVEDAAKAWLQKVLDLVCDYFNVNAAELKTVWTGQEAVISSPAGTTRFKDIYRIARTTGAILEVVHKYNPSTTLLDLEKGQGNPYSAYTYGVQLASLNVNELTGKVKLNKLVSLVNVGQVINPKLLEGQVEGGSAMGLGYALLEEIQLKGGRVLNPNFSSYLIPTSCDLAPIECHALPFNDQKGPYGAVGIGEPATIPVAAAIANAVSQATGVQFFKLPLTLEDVVLGIGKEQGN